MIHSWLVLVVSPDRLVWTRGRSPRRLDVLKRLGIGNRGSVAILTAVMLPGLAVAVALGVEAASWSAARVSIQRSADMSALAGAINYKATSSNQAAATFAARIAQLNGGIGTATPSWNSSTNTLTDNQITVQIVSGVASSSGNALKVTFQKSIPAAVSRAFSANATYTVIGSSTAELVATSGSFYGGGGAGSGNGGG